MAKRRNGEGTWGKKKIKGIEYQFYRDDKGKYFYGKTQKEVKAKIKAYHEQQFNTIILSDPEIAKQPFGDYVVAWLTDQKKNIKQHTLDGYENCIKGQLLDFEENKLSDIQVGALTTEKVKEYYNALTKKYARSTISKNYAILSQCIKYGNKKGVFKETIDLDEIVLPHEEHVVKKKKKIQFLDEKDVQKLCEEAQRINTPGFNWGGKIGEPTYGNNAKLLIFLIFTGLRISEAIDLQWRDVDLDSDIKRIKISSTSVQLKNRKENATTKYITSSSSTKTQSGERFIPLNDKALEIIEYERKLNPKHKPNDYVFITKNGGKIQSRQNVNRTLKQMVVRSGCTTDCTPHELRHTFGSLLLKKGVDIKIVSELLGHKDISVTYNIYIHILEEQKVSALNVLNVL